MAVIRREELSRWLLGYEKAWREPGTARLAELFTYDVVYSPSPWSDPVVGLEALAEFWEAEREGPDEPFWMTSEVLALDNETAVVRVAVTYERQDRLWRDLWVLRFASGGRCDSFEEWPFAAPDTT
jgi:SnoaL-like domain